MKQLTTILILLVTISISYQHKIQNPPKFKLDDPVIPDSFDAREAWPKCANVIGQIRDQSTCNSSWAYSSVAVMSDRICIHSNAAKKVQVSVEDLNNCCWACGDILDGCGKEKDAVQAFLWWWQKGIVTGGDYGTKEGCKPYSFAPCDHYVSGSYGACGQPSRFLPECLAQCSDPSLSYEKEKTFGSSIFYIGSEQDVQVEILTNGPVVGSLQYMQDFYDYKTGVYEYKLPNFVGQKYVKILGWGVEDGKKYWLCANTWNEEWGDKGYFKLIRGVTKPAIELTAVAGLPNLDSIH